MEHQTDYGQAWTLRVCEVSASEYEIRYKIQTPDVPAGGGYVIASFREVSRNLEVDVQITPSTDSNPLDTFMHGDSTGGDFDTWFAARPGAEFFIGVSDLFGGFIGRGQVSVSATYVPVADQYEPNNGKAEAKPLPAGAPIQAYAFDGYGRPNSVISTGWYDWFKITLKGGTPSITLSGAPANFSLDVSLDDPNQQMGYAATGSTLATGAVTIKPAAALPAGDYFLIVVPSTSIIDAYGKGAKPAAYATMPYTLSWTE